MEINSLFNVRLVNVKIAFFEKLNAENEQESCKHPHKKTDKDFYTFRSAGDFAPRKSCSVPD